MYSINYTHQFKKDMRKCAKRGLDIEEIKTAIKILSETGALPAEYKPHLLKGDRKGQRLSGDRSLACKWSMQTHRPFLLPQRDLIM